MGLSALGVQQSFNSDADVSQLTKENIEALADPDEREVVDDGGGGGGMAIKCYSSLKYEYGASVVECSTCTLKENSSDKRYSLSDS